MAIFNSFIFDSSKGETPQTVAMKRAIAAQIMGQMGNRPARNVGEGIGNAFASIGNGIVANVMNRRAGAAQEEGEKSATGLYDSIVSGITNGTPISSGTVPMTDASGEVSATAPGGANYRDAIAGIESAGSGDYAAVGPRHPRLGRALGRYQIMEANIGPWSQAALGRTVTPDEFMANPALQDAIFDNQFNQYVQKYGPEGAAQAWLGGEGGVGKTDRKDSLGTSIGEYGKRFMASMGGAPAAIEAIAPTGGSLSDEVADFRNTPEFLQAFPGGYQQQPLTDQQFNDRFGGEPSQANALAASTPQTAGQQALQQQAQANPVQVAQATPQQDMLGGLSVQQLMQAASNPWLNENQRAVVNMLLQQKMQSMDPSHQLDMQRGQLGLELDREKLNQLRNPVQQVPDSVQALDMRAQRAGLVPGTKEYNDFMIAGGKGPLVNVNTGSNNSKFVEESDKAAAGRLNDIVTAGQAAPQTMADMQQLIELGAQIGTGPGTQIKAALGPYAQALGIDVDNLSEIQAYEAITSRLAPQMRAVGSGSSSDRDVALFFQSLPNIRNFPGANEVIGNTMKAVAQNKMDAADIARRAQRGEIPWQEADKLISELPNPYDLFKKFQEETKKAQVSAGDGSPMSGAVVDGYRFKGGDPADPNNWERAN